MKYGVFSISLFLVRLTVLVTNEISILYAPKGSIVHCIWYPSVFPSILIFYLLEGHLSIRQKWSQYYYNLRCLDSTCSVQIVCVQFYAAEKKTKIIWLNWLIKGQVFHSSGLSHGLTISQHVISIKCINIALICYKVSTQPSINICIDIVKFILWKITFCVTLLLLLKSLSIKGIYYQSSFSHLSCCDIWIGIYRLRELNDKKTYYLFLFTY